MVSRCGIGHDIDPKYREAFPNNRPKAVTGYATESAFRSEHSLIAFPVPTCYVTLGTSVCLIIKLHQRLIMRAWSDNLGDFSAAV